MRTYETIKVDVDFCNKLFTSKLSIWYSLYRKQLLHEVYFHCVVYTACIA